jgi:limonene-1,2-epoxide hydrolase
MTDDAAVRAYAAYYADLTSESVGNLRALVAADVHFKDPFNDVRGVDRMIRMLEKMFEDASDVRFELGEQACAGDLCFLRWRFFFRPRRVAREIWPVDGVSAVRFDQDDKVVEHIDYWDAAEQIYERLPVLGNVLRPIRERLGLRD